MKRFLALTALALAGVLGTATTGNAVSFSATANPASGNVTVGSTILVDIFLNTEGQLEMVIADVGILFDGQTLQFNEAQSTMTSYILYSDPVPGKPPIPARWMQPLENHINGGTLDFIGGLDATPKLFTGTIPDLVTVGYRTPDFLGTRVTGEGILLATVAFDVIAQGDGSANIDLAMTSANNVTILVNNVITDITNQVTLDGAFTYTVPEPGLALMGFAAIGTLAALARRGRSN